MLSGSESNQNILRECVCYSNSEKALLCSYPVTPKFSSRCWSEGDNNVCSPKDFYKHFPVILQIIPPDWEQPRCVSVRDRVLVWMHQWISLGRKRKKLLIHMRMWAKRQNLCCASERSLIHKSTYLWFHLCKVLEERKLFYGRESWMRWPSRNAED